MTWVRVAEGDDFAIGEIRVVDAGDRRLLLIKHEKGVAITDVRCPHAGASLVGGRVAGTRIRCPSHGYMFDLETGKCPRASREGFDHLTVYAVELREDGVFVSM